MNNFKEKISKSILNELVNENVIPRFTKQIIKGQSLLPFFYACTYKCNNVFTMYVQYGILISTLIIYGSTKKRLNKT